MPRRVLDRRTVLRGTLAGLGVSVALPPLEAMLNSHGTALASGAKLPRRFGIFFWGNGVRLSKWVPKDRGRGWTTSEALAPLAAFKEDLSVVSGMDVLTGAERAHHSGCVGILSGAPMVQQPHPTSGYASTFSAPSIDQIVADAWAGRTPFRSLELGVSRRVVDGEGTTLAYLSHRGPDNPNPAEFDPGRAFDRLFGPAGRTLVGAATPLSQRRAQDGSVLDVVSEELRTLRRQIGHLDGQRVDQHLDNIRSIETRLRGKWRHACQAPTRVAGATYEKGGKEPLEEINEAMAHVLATALACDLTRVFTMQFSGSVGNTVLWQVGATRSHHGMTHDEPGDQPQVQASTVFIMKQLAKLLQVLKQTPDGAGNLLDRMALLATTDCAEGREHTLKDYPMLVIGRAGGALKPGLHHRAEGENASKVLLSCVRAVGVKATSLGHGGGRVTEGCTAIEA